MKKFLFDNWHQWKVCFLSGCQKFLWGLCRIITCILFGIISIFVHICKQIGAFCKREPAFAIIIGLIGFFGLICCVRFLAKERAARITAEFQRDSLLLKLDSAKQNAFVRESSEYIYDGTH